MRRSGREKLCVYSRCPYRKPTQVDEERILRPTGEGVPCESRAAENRLKQLFSKNTGLCETER